MKQKYMFYDEQVNRERRLMTLIEVEKSLNQTLYFLILSKATLCFKNHVFKC